MNRRSSAIALVLPIVGLLIGWPSPGQAMTVTELDITGGSVSYHGRFTHVLDRLLDRGPVVKMGEYQPIGEIVPSITKGRTTFSLFTSGFNGAPPPSATVDGSSIVANLSSLYFAVSSGRSTSLWNIGGQATGTFDPETSQFTLSWKDQVPSAFGGPRSDVRPSRGHVLESFLGALVRVKDEKGDWGEKGKWHHARSREATFILEGTAIVGGAPTPVPTPASLTLYITGLLGLVAWGWFTQRQVGIV
jgi:hypothetical protein